MTQSSGSRGIRMLAIAVIFPAIVTIVSVIVLLRLAATGPASVATHWGYSGPPDGFGSPYTYAILMGSISVVLVTALGGGSVLLSHRGPVTRVIKLLGVASIWMTLFLGFTLIGALLEQRSTASVAHAAGPGLWLIIGIVVGAVFAVCAWFLMPKAVIVSSGESFGPSGEPAALPVLLSGSERASWHRTATASRGVTWLLIGLIFLIGVVELIVVNVSSGRVWFIAFVPVILLLVVFVTLTWSVRIDGRGVRMRSVVGLPTFFTPIENIVSASVVSVHAFSEYGGWGVRWNLAGRMGIILRSGEALQIHRHKGVDLVITIDDAATAAGLINGLVQRGHAIDAAGPASD